MSLQSRFDKMLKDTGVRTTVSTTSKPKKEEDLNGRFSRMLSDAQSSYKAKEEKKSAELPIMPRYIDRRTGTTSLPMPSFISAGKKKPDQFDINPIFTSTPQGQMARAIRQIPGLWNKAQAKALMNSKPTSYEATSSFDRVPTINFGEGEPTPQIKPIETTTAFSPRYFSRDVAKSKGKDNAFVNTLLKPAMASYHQQKESDLIGEMATQGVDDYGLTRYNEQKAKDYEYTPNKSLVGRGIQGVSGVIGQQAANALSKEFLAGVVADMLGAGGYGTKAAFAKNSFDAQAGQLYKELVTQGIDPDTAIKAASVGGGINAALEFAQLDEIAKGAKTALGKGTQKAVQEMTEQGAKAALKQGLKSWGKETLEEQLQENVSMLSEDWARRQSGMDGYSLKDYIERNKQTLPENAMTMALLGLPGTVGSIGQANSLKTQNKANLDGIQKERSVTKESDVMPNVANPVERNRQEIAPFIPSEENTPNFNENYLRLDDKTVLSFDELEEFQRKNAQNFSKIADKLNFELEFFSGDPRQNGYYKDGKVQININSPRAMSSTFAHEAYHFLRMQDKNEKLNTFENFLLNNAGTLLQNESLDNAIQNKMAEYRQYGVDLTLYDAKEEVFAEAVGRLFEDEKAIQHLYKTDRNLFQRVYDWIVHTISKIGKDADTKLLMDAQRKFVLAMQESSGVLQENADNSPMASYVGTDANGIRHYESDYNGQNVSDQEILDNFKNRIATVFNLGDVELNTRTGRLEIRGDKYTKKKNATSINAIIDPTNKRAMMEHYNDLADILENAVQVGFNDEKLRQAQNPDEKIKPSHKDVLYWHTFRNEVVLNNVPYEVIFDIREKTDGNGYAYRIHLNDLSKQKRLGSQPVSISGIGQTPQPLSTTSVLQREREVNTQNEKYSFGDPLYEKRGQGYIGKSMSVNAKLAYDNEEMPISKWSKKAILQHIDELLDEDDLIVDGLEKMTKDQLISTFLRNSSWHHTGALYNKTNFYSINVDKVLENARAMTEDELEAKAIREQIAQEKRNKEYEDRMAWKEKAERKRELEKEFEKKFGFEYGTVAHYIKNNPHTFGVSKNGNDVVIFEYDGHQRSVPLFDINRRNLIGYNPDIEAELNDSKYSFGDGTTPPISFEYAIDNPSRQQKVRSVFETASESGRVAPEIRENILQNIKDKAPSVMYDVISNKETIDKAKRILETQGVEQTEAAIEHKIATNQNLTLDDLAIAIGMVEHYSKIGDLEKSERMIADLAVIGTETGRKVQLLSLLKKQTPQGALLTLERKLQRINSRLDADRQIMLSDNARADILSSKAGTEDQLRAVANAEEEIYKQMPSTWWDKWNAWRYLSMLGNPRTHIRNIAGNLMFGIQKGQKDIFGAIAESMVSKANPKMMRTKTIAPVDKNLKLIANHLFNEYSSDITGEGKENTNLDRRIFKNNLLESARKFNSMALEAEDAFFLQGHFKKSLAKFLKANGFKAEELATISTDRQGKRFAQMKQLTGDKAKLLDKGIQYAIKEAQRATFRDPNQIASLISMAKTRNKAVQIGLDSLMPFTKTPMNIMRRGYEYSPLGVIEGFRKIHKKAKGGRVTTADIIDAFSVSASGTTTVFALGMALAQAGYVTGNEEEEEKQINDLENNQNYALQIGDYSFTLDWAAPLSLPFFLGVEAYNVMQGKSAGEGAIRLTDSITKLSDPMINMSMLQGLNKTFNEIKYAKSNSEAVGNVIATNISGYINQGVPTLGGQIARSMDDVRRTKYVDKNSLVPKMAQQFKNDVQAKVPYWSQSAPTYIDPFGHEQKTGDIFFRVAQNMLLPGFLNKKETNAVTEELRTLYEYTGDKTVLPKKAERQIDGKYGKKFTAEEYEAYNKTRGQKTEALLKELVANQGYKQLSEDERSTMIKNAYEYAKALADNKHLGKPLENKFAEMQDLEKGGMKYTDLATTNLFKKQFKEATEGDKVEAAKLNPFRNLSLKGKAREEYILSQMSDSAQRKYKHLKARGIADADTYFITYMVAKSQAGEDRTKEEKVRDLMRLGYSEGQAWSILTILNSTSKKWQ